MDKIFGTFGKAGSENGNGEKNEQWISMSDLMAGLMMVFMLISIAFMLNQQETARKEQETARKVRDVAIIYQNIQGNLHQRLLTEFKDDLPVWDAEIDPSTLEFRFKSPEVLFGTGEIHLRPQFKNILDDFFPRYLKVINEFRDNITDIRIEGHTSSVWNQHTSTDMAYFLNMELSQGRTRSVLNHVYNIPAVEADRDWIKSKFSAVGYSSSQLVLDDNEQEDQERSRRVSFRVLTNAEEQLRKILEIQ